MIKCFLSAVAGLLILGNAVGAESILKAEKLGEGIYALVGPIGPRLPENFGLNANYGVIDTAQGAIPIDSGASSQAAKLLESGGKTTYPQTSSLGDQYGQPGSPLAGECLFPESGSGNHRP